MKIVILYSTAGEGHRTVAEAIHEAIHSVEPSYSVTCIDALSFGSSFFKSGYSQLYFACVRYVPWLWGFLYYFSDSKYASFLIAPIRFLWNRSQSRGLMNYLKTEKPDVVIATHFYPAEVVSSAKRKREINTHLITVVTDVIPHRFWLNSNTDIFWVMAEESRNILLKNNVSPEQIKVGGIPIKLAFNRNINRNDVLSRYGLSFEKKTLLFTSGGFGLGPTEMLLEQLEPYKENVQAVVVCGHNDMLKAKLTAKKFGFSVVIMGFVQNMHELMAASDLLIAKPGGATTSESLAMNVPMFMTAAIPGQETMNQKWLLDHGAAISLSGLGDFREIIHKLATQPEFTKTYKSAIHVIAKPNAALDLAYFITH